MIVPGQSRPCNSSRVTNSPGFSSSTASSRKGCSCRLRRLPFFVSSPARRSASKTANFKCLEASLACMADTRAAHSLARGRQVRGQTLPNLSVGHAARELFDFIIVSRAGTLQRNCTDRPRKLHLVATHHGHVCNGLAQAADAFLQPFVLFCPAESAL